MRILVVEDTPKHQEAARETLQDHDLTIIDTYEEAVVVLTKGDCFDAVLADMMLPVNPYFTDEAASRDGRKRFLSLSTEAINKYSGQEAPLGFVLALLAAKHGAKYVAVVTDTNHHQSPMSASLDPLSGGYWSDDYRADLTINGAKAMFVHTPFLVRGNRCCPHCGSGSTSSGGDVPKDMVQCFKCKELYQKGEHTDLKDWGMVLRALMGE